MPFLMRFLVPMRRMVALVAWLYGMARIRGWLPWLLMSVLALYLVSKVHESRAKNMFAAAVFVVTLILIILASHFEPEREPLDKTAQAWVQLCEQRSQDPILLQLQQQYAEQDCEDLWRVVGQQGRLYLSGLNLENIDLLVGLPRLRVLDLSHNKVTSIRVMQDMKALWNLNLSHNPLQNLEGLPQNLRELDLEQTQVESVEVLASLKFLRILNLTKTPVQDVSPLEGLSGLQKLRMEGAAVLDPQHWSEERCPLSEGVLGYQCQQYLKLNRQN